MVEGLGGGIMYGECKYYELYIGGMGLKVIDNGVRMIGGGGLWWKGTREVQLPLATDVNFQ
jgi:hypothetical protein